MPPIALNRRRFLGCSAAAGLALTQGRVGEAAGAGADAVQVRLGLIGLGTRGTTQLRTALELPGVTVTAICDTEPKHRLRGQGIVEKATGHRPETSTNPSDSWNGWMSTPSRSRYPATVTRRFTRRRSARESTCMPRNPWV